MGNTLNLIDPALTRIVENATEDQLRKMTLVACELACKENRLNHPLIEQALTALRSGVYGNQVLKEQVEKLTEELDETQWDIQDKVEQGSADQDEYTIAFQRARAASAIYSALDDDPLEAAINALYEVNFSLGDDKERLKKLISSGN